MPRSQRNDLTFLIELLSKAVRPSAFFSSSLRCAIGESIFNLRYAVMVSTGTNISSSCSSPKFLGTTSDQIAHMSAFIDSTEREGQKNYYGHAEALRAVFNLFAEVMSPSPQESDFSISYVKLKIGV